MGRQLTYNPFFGQLVMHATLRKRRNDFRIAGSPARIVGLSHLAA
jgi:hypothetical protein